MKTLLNQNRQKKLFDINNKIILEINNSKNIKTKFINPKILFDTICKNLNQKYPRKIIIYKTRIPHHIGSMVKSGIKIFRIKHSNKIRYILSYSQEKGMVEVKTIPCNVNIAVDLENKHIRLVGQDAIGGWIDQINPLYNSGTLTLYDKKGKTMSSYCLENLKKKSENKSKLKNQLQ